MTLQKQKLKKLSSLNNKFDTFLFGDSTITESGYYMSFFRIAIGLIAIVDIVSLIPDLKLFFSKDKTIIPQELAYLFSDYFDFLHSFYILLSNFGLVDFFYSYSIYFYIASLIFMTIGFKTRLFVFLSLFFQTVIFKSFNIFNYGFDNFLTMSLFYCLVFPVGKVNSIDNFYFKNKTQVKIPFKRFLQLHLCVVYVTSGIAKCLDPNWLDGNAIYRASASIFKNSIHLPAPIYMIVSISVLFLEMFYPLIFYSKLRKYFLFGIVTMHLGIAIILELYSFALIMIVWNLSAFYTFKIKLNNEN
jgi:hypothetical protein